jgi:valyl-tRNA synthetase
VLPAQPGGRPELPELTTLTLPERWLLSRHESCLAEVDAALDQFRFADAAQAVHRFIWSEFCDWGLEMAKVALGTEGPERDHAGAVLAWVLERSLRILHPFMPFVTEEIWQRFGAGESIVVASWPERHEEHLFAEEPGVEGGFRVLRDVITRIRQARSDYGIPQQTRLRLVVSPGPLQLLVEEYEDSVRRMANLSMIETSEDRPDRTGLVRLPVEASEVLLDAGEAFDADAARERIRRKLAAAQTEGDKARQKLGNASFLDKAPADVRSKVEMQAAEADRRVVAFTEQLEGLG